MTFLRYSCIDAEPSGVILTLSGPERQEKYQALLRQPPCQHLDASSWGGTYLFQTALAVSAPSCAAAEL